MSGIQTFVLIMWLSSSFGGGTHVVANYGSLGECRQAAKMAMETSVARNAACIVGPVEGR